MKLVSFEDVGTPQPISHKHERGVDGGTCFYFYRIDPDMTDKQFESWAYHEHWHEISSPYDCTGQTFTTHIDSKRIDETVVACVIGYGVDV